ncbi:hypothetical protein V5799_005835 [Amblyomma americanum]|uniref:Sulfotransferase n=1 Tax=Amblyomma americanum TaxID=6943 RepID=A0AAQ4DY45_AMBAM
MLEDDGDAGRKRLERILEMAKQDSMRKAMKLDLANIRRADLKARLKDLNTTMNTELVRDPTHFNFVRQGKVGGWKEHFNHDQLHHMEAAIMMKTRGSGIMDLGADIRHESLPITEELCH